MSRKIWMDRTIEAAREADIRMPWSRKPAPQPAPEPLPLRAKA
ncbi:hypothetical protein [Jannaschia pohangensis]|uniref:Uncharacterized protein n=1 Tax=Jannaschia pohangensis TaxID=390807 RepID=A0A1I3MP59_9RHOB|nr:hypothetical protein [Jannaschia pohangensis]SFI98914.1 hypothetical protein SAMN04488095_1916 [Jannaschia pohangensis]